MCWRFRALSVDCWTGVSQVHVQVHPFCSASSYDLATPGDTTLRSLIALLEQQLQAGEEKLNARKSNILGRLSAALERARKAFASAKV